MRQLVRNPIIPLPLNEASIATAGELLIQDNHLYRKNADGSVSLIYGSTTSSESSDSSSSSGGSDHVFLTIDEYNALSYEEQHNGSMYFIIPSSSSIISSQESANTVVYQLTQEEYDALSYEEQHNGTTYIILNADINSNNKIDLVLSITQDEYDALPDEKKLDGTIYFITDAKLEDCGYNIMMSLTYTEYMALTDDERSNGCAYFIEDYEGVETDLILGDNQKLVISKTAKDYGFAYGNEVTSYENMIVFGHYNSLENIPKGDNEGTTGTALLIGNGTAEEAGNAFRVDYDGSVHSDNSYHTSGADYAEFFEWEKIPANPEHKFVTLNGEKIKLADIGDYILGVTSTNPSIIGNSPESVNRLKDKNYAAVGLLGVLDVEDDGSCIVNGYCKPHNGIARISGYGYRVMARLSDNMIRILVK